MSIEKAIESIQQVVEQERDFVVGLTRDLVRIPSVNPKFEANEKLNREPEVQAHLARVLEEIGLTTQQQEVFPNRPNLIGTLAGSDERSLLLNGHVDVVPVVDEAKWTVDPFGGEIRDGRVWGRGAIDMKCGIATMAAAVRAIGKAGYRPIGRIDFHAVVDEEAGGFGAAHAARTMPKARAGIVTEPTWGDILPAAGGLEWVRVAIPGKSAHAGWRYNTIYPQRHDNPKRLEPGVNAIELGTLFIMALREFEREWGMNKFHPLLPPGITTINPGVVIGGVSPDADGKPTLLSNPAIIPDAFVVDLDLKFLPQEKKETVRAEFEAFVRAFASQHAFLRQNPPRVIWELQGLHFPPLDTPVDHAIVQSLVSQRKALGLPVEISAMAGVCDAAHYSGAGIPCVIYGCAGDGLHGIDEYVEIDSLVETTKVLAATIAEFCGLREI